MVFVRSEANGIRAVAARIIRGLGGEIRTVFAAVPSRFGGFKNGSLRAPGPFASRFPRTGDPDGHERIDAATRLLARRATSVEVGNVFEKTVRPAEPLGITPAVLSAISDGLQSVTRFKVDTFVARDAFVTVATPRIWKFRVENAVFIAIPPSAVGMFFASGGDRETILSGPRSRAPQPQSPVFVRRAAKLCPFRTDLLYFQSFAFLNEIGRRDPIFASFAQNGNFVGSFSNHRRLIIPNHGA